MSDPFEADSAPAGRGGFWQGLIVLALEWPPFRLLLILLELGSFVIGAIGIWYAAAALDVSNQDRITARLDRALDQLLEPPSGLSDLGPNLKLLFDNDAGLSGIAIACPKDAIQTDWSAEFRCAETRYFNDFAIRGRPGADGDDRAGVVNAMHRVEFNSVDFSGMLFDSILISSTSFINVGFIASEFRDCRMTGAHFSGSKLIDTVFNGCQMADSTFRYSDLSTARFENISLNALDVSGATLCRGGACVQWDGALAGQAYYYDDDTPVMDGLAQELQPLFVCAASLRRVWPHPVDETTCTITRHAAGANVPAPGEDWIVAPVPAAGS